MLAALAILAAGCASPNVNPPEPRSNTGYVDFRADAPGEFYWDVSQLEEGSQNSKSIYSECNPPEGGVLRLAFRPGLHRLRITILNRVVVTPAEIAVDVQDGKITPVRITLADVGAVSIQTRGFGTGHTLKNNRRQIEYGSSDSRQYELSAQAEPPRAYQPKEPMPARQ